MSMGNYLQRITQLGSLAALLTLGCEKDGRPAYQSGFFAQCQSASCCEQVDECLEEQVEMEAREGEAASAGSESVALEEAAAGCTAESWECHDMVMERCYQPSYSSPSGSNLSSYPRCVDVDVKVMNAAELKHKNKYFETDMLFKLFRQYGSSKELIDQSYSGEFREVFARPDQSSPSSLSNDKSKDQPTQFRAGLFKTMRTPLFWQDHKNECQERRVNPDYDFMLKDGSCQVKQFGSAGDCDARSYIQCEFFYDSTSSQPMQPEKRQYEWSMDVGVELWGKVGEKIFCDYVPTSSKPICFPPFGW